MVNIFAGFVVLGDTLNSMLLTTDSNGQAIMPDTFPSFVVVGESGTVLSGTSTYTRNLTGASASGGGGLITVTANAHGLQTAARVFLSGFSGTLASTINNNFYVITRVDANTFTLDGTAASGTATGGNVALVGAFNPGIVCSQGNGFSAGRAYVLLWSYKVSGQSRAAQHTFMVT